MQSFKDVDEISFTTDTFELFFFVLPMIGEERDVLPTTELHINLISVVQGWVCSLSLLIADWNLMSIRCMSIGTLSAACPTDQSQMPAPKTWTTPESASVCYADNM